MNVNANKKAKDDNIDVQKEGKEWPNLTY
jgi:hypothetical protein